MLDDHLLSSHIPVDLIRRHKEQLKREIQVGERSARRDEQRIFFF